MTSCSVLRRASRCSSSRDTFGSGTPAICASRSTASGKVTPSDSMTKSKIEPFLPEEKSNQACFWSLTKKDGVFSLLNGDRPLNSRPERVSRTRLPTTSETGSRAFSSSRNWGVKRMALPPRVLARGVESSGWPNRFALIIGPQIETFRGDSGNRC